MRAKKGGQVGQNGEPYKGGQFLPNTNLPKRGGSKPTGGSRRQLVEPGVLEEGPEGYTAILVLLSGVYADNEGGTLIPRDNLKFTAERMGIETRKIFRLINAYNEGGRWIEISGVFGSGRIVSRNFEELPL
jgi:hypothetical protein